MLVSSSKVMTKVFVIGGVALKEIESRSLKGFFSSIDDKFVIPPLPPMLSLPPLKGFRGGLILCELYLA
jgi:hypothetical protein